MPESRHTSSRESSSDHDRHHQHASGPQPFWSGSLAFGLVNLPVGLFPAQHGGRVSLHMVDASGTRLTRRYYCEHDGRVLKSSQIIRGYEIEKGRFIEVSDKELEAQAPERSQQIDLKRFVRREEIDPMYFERAYYLTPDQGAIKAYRLLAHSLEESGRAGIATFVMRDRAYLVAIIAEKGILRAETLRFSEELRSPKDIGLPELATPRKGDVSHMKKAIRARRARHLKRDWLEDGWSERVLDHIGEKLESGEDVLHAEEREEAIAEDEGQGGDVIDLMAVLKKSLEQGDTPGTRRKSKKPRETKGRQDGSKKQSSSRNQSRSEKQKGSKKQEGSKKQGRSKVQKDSGGQSRQTLTSLSKQALYEKAQAADISGRSRMNRNELISALQDQ